MGELVSSGRGWAITTPLFAANYYAAYDSITYAPWSPMGLSRRLRLVSRRRELGQAPREIAGVAKQVLRETCLPWIRQRIPWAADDFVIAG